ncbi:MAG: hypothetical protein ACYS8Z_08215, partial [Planctomycetota bacterium]
MGIFRKTSPRRNQVRKSIPIDRFSQLSRFANRDSVASLFICLCFIALTVPIISFDFTPQFLYRTLILTTILVVLVCMAAVLYIAHYQKRLMTNHTRAFSLAVLLMLLLGSTKLVALLFGRTWGATGSAVTAAIILSLAYDQRFTMGICILFAILAVFASKPAGQGQLEGMNLLLTMSAGIVTCCFSLKEIRTRIKLLQVSAVAAIMIFITAGTTNLLSEDIGLIDVLKSAGPHAGLAFFLGAIIQGFLPLIEQAFQVATSMTLLAYS